MNPCLTAADIRGFVITWDPTWAAGPPPNPTAAVTLPRHVINPSDGSEWAWDGITWVQYASGAGSVDIDGVASGPIIGGRPVELTAAGVVHFDPADPDAPNRCAGIAVNSASTGQPVQVRPIGLLHRDAWGLTPNARYFAGLSGALTTVVPLSGSVVAIGHAVTADDLMIQISTYLVRS